MQLAKLFRISHLEIMLVSFGVGAWAPLVWYYWSNGGQELCHIGAQFIGPLLIHLPGCQVTVARLLNPRFTDCVHRGDDVTDVTDETM